MEQTTKHHANSIDVVGIKFSHMALKDQYPDEVVRQGVVNNRIRLLGLMGVMVMELV